MGVTICLPLFGNPGRELEEGAPEDDGVLLLLCDMDGDLELVLDCFDVSLA